MPNQPFLLLTPLMINADPVNDQKLVRDFLRTRSESAFLRLYRSKTPHLYQMALRLTQDEYQSEELVQEMWVIALRKLADFEWRSELKTWLTGILINLFRSGRKEKEREEALTVDIGDRDISSGLTFATYSDLENGIAQLPPGYRQIIILHDVEGYKHKEIAGLLDITEGTSKSQLFHARKALRAYLNEDTVKRKGHE